MAKASVEPIHHPPPPREVLADCIGRHSLALENLARVNRAHADAEQKVYAAADALKNAEVQRDEARLTEGSRLASAALGEQTGPSLADAEAALAKATDDLTVARRTRDALLERSQREATELTKAERALNAAIVNVIMSEAPISAMLERAQKLQADLIAARLELRWLQKMNCIPADAETAVRGFLLDTALPSGLGGIENGNWSGDHPATEPWLAAAAALKEAASAKLPKA